MVERLEEELPHPVEGAPRDRARLERDAGVELPRPRARQEAERWIQGVAHLLEVDLVVPQIVGIVELETPAGRAACGEVAGAVGAPETGDQGLVAEEPGGLPDGVRAAQ